MKCILSVIAAVFFVGVSAHGQAPPPQAAPQAAPQVEVTKADEQKYQKVKPTIAKIEKKLGDKINKLDKADPAAPDKARQFQHEAQQEMVEAVQSSGLSIPKYNALAQKEHQ